MAIDESSFRAVRANRSQSSDSNSSGFGSITRPIARIACFALGGALLFWFLESYGDGTSTRLLAFVLSLFLFFIGCIIKLALIASSFFIHLSRETLCGIQERGERTSVRTGFSPHAIPRFGIASLMAFRRSDREESGSHVGCENSPARSPIGESLRHLGNPVRSHVPGLPSRLSGFRPWAASGPSELCSGFVSPRHLLLPMGYYLRISYLATRVPTISGR